MMLQHLLIAVGGMVILVGVWSLVLTLARRYLPERTQDGDALSCGSCVTFGGCSCGLRHPTQQGAGPRTEDQRGLDVPSVEIAE